MNYYIRGFISFIFVLLSNYYVFAMTPGELYDAQASNIDPNKLAPIFRFGSDYTNLQREDTLSQIKDKVIEWTIPVYEIERIKDGLYRITSIDDDGFGLVIVLTTNSQDEKNLIHSLKTGSRLSIKGVLTGETTMRALDIEPAIIYGRSSSNNTGNSISTIKLLECEHVSHTTYAYISGVDVNNDKIEFTGDDALCEKMSIGGIYNIYWNGKTLDDPNDPNGLFIREVIKVIPSK